MRDEFTDLETLSPPCAHSSTINRTMSTSKTPPDIIQDGEKNPRGIPKALFIVRALLVFWTFSIPCAADYTLLQNDVEEYLGGPDAAVENIISAFQDTLACVYRLCILGQPLTSSCLCSLNVLSLLRPVRPCRKYRYMDSNLTQRRRGLEEKIPDIKKTLSMVEYLRDRRVRYRVGAVLHAFVALTFSSSRAKFTHYPY